MSDGAETKKLFPPKVSGIGLVTLKTGRDQGINKHPKLHLSKLFLLGFLLGSARLGPAGADPLSALRSGAGPRAPLLPGTTSSIVARLDSDLSSVQDFHFLRLCSFN
ncbi:hypothetical protein KOW79_011026 [Hemibagrus wyckioides]|uniref:Uncharacterized protein n=1 Tax=Hemibagrus wyckioides TaxID=337641 RepID=A0A9D3SI46_9TELE|nr:hypothetical protein KOW79_011026 [Hemibagrus wyckioides]